MLSINKSILTLAFTIMASVLSPLAHAESSTIELPPETAKFKPSSLPGYQLAKQNCMLCHSVDYIMYQPPGQSLDKWTKELFKMRHSYGAPISGLKLRAIAAYLAVTYGSAKKTDEDVIAASKILEQKPGTKIDGTDEVKRLLTDNACFICHAIDRNVVGPSFQSIAAKYKNDPQATDILAKSIQSGGLGKWGEISMPPMNELSYLEAKSLAEFVLKQ